MKTRDEVEELKRQWKLDPCWDVYETEGFEEYREELVKFQADMEAYWADLRRGRLLNKAFKLGVPGNIQLAEAWELMEYKLDELKNRVWRLEA